MTRVSDHYTIITADSHAGASHATYREYLDPKFHEDFDAWRGKYRNPYKDLGDTRRFRNWDNDMRVSQQHEDGVVGEVVFPNTVPPFFPSFVLFAGPPRPEDYEHRHAGILAHNRWLADWCGDEFSDQRAGIGQIFLNDVDDALADLKWNKEHGLRGGALIPNIPPDAVWMKPLYDPIYEPVWSACEDMEIPVNVHGGTGVPDYGPGAIGQLMYITEGGFYSQRPLVQFILSGIFERHPKLKMVITETGCSWVPPLLKRLDWTISKIRDTGATGEIRYSKDAVLPKLASEYFTQNVWMGISQPGPADITAADQVLAPGRFMWGSDYPHDEGTHPFTREHLRALFHDRPEAELRDMLAGNCAKLYDFDLEALQPLADKYGPTVEELKVPFDTLPDNANDALRNSLVTRP